MLFQKARCMRGKQRSHCTRARARDCVHPCECSRVIMYASMHASVYAHRHVSTCVRVYVCMRVYIDAYAHAHDCLHLYGSTDCKYETCN